MKANLLADVCRIAEKQPFRRGRTDFLLSKFEADRKAFASLIDSNPVEAKVQRFLEEHPVVLLHAVLDGFYPVASTRSALFAKVQLGSDYETDFAYCSLSSMGMWWTFIELEKPDAPLFNQAGDPSKYLSHAIRQVMDWQAWVSDYQGYAKAQLEKLISPTAQEFGWGFTDFRRPCKSLIIIGRRSDLTANTNRLRAQLCSSTPYMEIVTYDRLVDDYNVDKEEDPDSGWDEMRTIREIDPTLISSTDQE